MKKVFLLTLAISSLFLFQSCKKKCETLILCPYPNTTVNKVVGNDTIRLFVPNAFSPNGDAINDHFICFGKNISSFECKIYRNDKNKTLIKTITAMDAYPLTENNYWDGTINGEIAVTVYSLKVKATTITGENISFDGTLSAIGGEFLNENFRHIEGRKHAIAQYENAQFPVQNDDGTFNPNFPKAEYLGDNEYNKCED